MLGSPIRIIVPRTIGTTILANGSWTIANGNGWVLIPLPDYADSFVTIGPNWPNLAGATFPQGGTPPVPAGIFCDYLGNPAYQIGVANVLSIIS